MNESSPDDIAALEAELAEAERRVVRRVDPGATALPVAIAVLVLLGSLMLPWTGGVAGWEILAGVANLGLLPRLFTCTAVLFGVLGSAVAGDTIWTEWEMAGTRLDGTEHLMRGVILFGVAAGRASWARFYLEPVQHGGGTVDSAVAAQLKGGVR